MVRSVGQTGDAATLDHAIENLEHAVGRLLSQSTDWARYGRTRLGGSRVDAESLAEREAQRDLQLEMQREAVRQTDRDAARDNEQDRLESED